MAQYHQPTLKSFNKKISFENIDNIKLHIASSPFTVSPGDEEKHNLVPIFQSVISSFLFSICCLFAHLSPGNFFDETETLMNALCSVFVLSFGFCMYVMINASCLQMVRDGFVSLPLVSIHPKANQLLIWLSRIFKVFLGLIVLFNEIKKVFNIEGIVLEMELLSYIILLSHMFCALLLLNIYFCFSIQSRERNYSSESCV
ncbi:predicted protein [Naegleria gruberi]|uniref:Predicted protein n=1 Tax=Naegleria gruberi TaxID=5762 RepID=D2VJ15_NAEGR|nr:uncharacterized protein NAEGRDRAFT_68872 [Naegleria gruberi]EFC43122.1 predicted protein [Naegleria gruberi]|eukprot:XP_002675866.1 predicted protein [Naegleria gruberi strain NEG-M]